jgi:soluble lytic murein transglycosylase-like protein
MILRSAKAVVMLAAVSLVPLPAHADVLEIGASGDARWVAGPMANSVVPDAEPLAEVPPEAALISDAAASQPALAARVIPAVYAAKVQELSARFDLSPALIEALVWQESRWHARAVSSAGARGLAQLMPGTAREMGVNPDDPFANLEGGARYLREQLDRFDGDVEKALAAYNAGPGRVMAANGVPAIAETQNYVASVMGRLSSHSRSPE